MRKAPFVTNYLTEHLIDDAFVTLDGYERAGGYRARYRQIPVLESGDRTTRSTAPRQRWSHPNENVASMSETG